MSLSPVPTRVRIVPQAGPAVWTAAELSPADWMIPVGSEDAAELGAAIAALDGKAPGGAADVSLPRLARVLADVAARLEHGRGFALLRGLPFDRDGPETAEAALLALGAHLGTPLAPAEAGTGPITRLTGPVEASAGAFAGPPRFHAEACDAVALLCLRNTPDGPPSILVSTGAVHNELLRTNRPALEALYRAVPLAEGDALREQAVFSMKGGAFSASYTRDAVEEAARRPGAEPLPEGLEAAFDLLDATCADPALTLALETRPGDLLLFNPHLVWKRRSLALADADAPLAAQEFRRLRLAVKHSRSAPAEPEG